MSNLTSNFCVACRETVYPPRDAGALFVSLFKLFRRHGWNVINSNCLCVVVMGLIVPVYVLALELYLLLFYGVYPGTYANLAKPSDVFGVPLHGFCCKL